MVNETHDYTGFHLGVGGGGHLSPLATILPPPPLENSVAGIHLNVVAPTKSSEFHVMPPTHIF